ncbi:Methyl-accepting chemotaxis serine transducer [Stenotrophomonas maltophilia RA8]|nr:Methyl-accepting chemotaxis serine transducer [Stenotrophomonas maltophilia RA8]
MTDIMAEISAASQEQSAGIEQVNQTVVQMDETTQQNAALVEEATAAARAMEDQAVQLGEAVARFRLASQGTTAAPTRLAAAPVPRQVATAAPAAKRALRASVAQPALAAEGDWQEF